MFKLFPLLFLLVSFPCCAFAGWTVQHLSSFEVMVADFVQHNPDGSSSEGVFFLDKQELRRMRVEYHDMPLVLTISRGVLTLRDIDLDEVSRYLSSDFDFLLKRGKNSSYDETLSKGKVCAVFVSGDNKISLDFSRNPDKIESISILSQDGSLRKMVFHNIKYYERPLEDQLFD